VELSLILRILHGLHHHGKWANLKELKKYVAVTSAEFERVLEKCLSEEPRMLEGRERKGLLPSMLRLLGLRQKEFRLAEEGKRIIESLS
jgi:hypothetical protein